MDDKHYDWTIGQVFRLLVDAPPLKMPRGRIWAFMRSVCRRWKEIIDIEYDYQGAIRMAVAGDFPSSLSFILTKIDPLHDETASSALRDALNYGHNRSFIILLRDGRLSPTNNLLPIAASKEHLEPSVRALLKDNRVDISYNQSEALRSACSVQILRLFLDHPGISLPDSDSLILSHVGKRKSAELLELLLSDKRVQPSRGLLFKMMDMLSINDPDSWKVILKGTVDIDEMSTCLYKD
jgi:hypothetical protein